MQTPQIPKDAIETLRNQPGFRDTLAYIQQLSTTADSLAIYRQDHPAMFQGRAQVYREIIQILSKPSL